MNKSFKRFLSPIFAAVGTTSLTVALLSVNLQVQADEKIKTGTPATSDGCYCDCGVVGDCGKELEECGSAPDCDACGCSYDTSCVCGNGVDPVPPGGD